MYDGKYRVLWGFTRIGGEILKFWILPTPYYYVTMKKLTGKDILVWLCQIWGMRRLQGCSPQKSLSIRPYLILAIHSNACNTFFNSSFSSTSSSNTSRRGLWRRKEAKKDLWMNVIIATRVWYQQRTMSISSCSEGPGRVGTGLQMTTRPLNPFCAKRFCPPTPSTLGTLAPCPASGWLYSTPAIAWHSFCSRICLRFQLVLTRCEIPI